MNQYAASTANANIAVTADKKEKKASLTERFKNYLLENADIIAPAIILMNGGYYRPSK